MKHDWEQAEADKFPILWYLCYDSSLAVLETRRKPKMVEKRSNVIMFDDVDELTNSDDVVATDKRVYYRMRLPYTERMLVNRLFRGDNLQALIAANGGELPAWYPALKEAS